MGLKPKWLNDFGLFEIEIGGQKHFIFHAYNMLNSQLGMQLARHKHLTRNVIDSYSMLNIPYIRPKTKKEVGEFLSKHKIIIAKPIFGFRAEGIYIIDSIKKIDKLDFENYLLEKFVRGKEMRYLVLNSRIVAVHQKVNIGVVNDPKTVKRISYAKDEWNKEMIKISLKLTQVMGLKFATVDFIINEQNKPYILEVNSAPGLYFFQYPTSGPSIDIAKMFLEASLNKIEEKIRSL